MASGDAIEQIKERISIVDVVAPYVELHNAGKSLKGKSPFTNEKTPSFFVSPDRGMYYCFSTSKGGDIFTFIQEMEGVDFKGALKILADKAGVELIPEDPKKKNEREQLFAVLEAATEFFEGMLSKKSAAVDYLHRRAVKDVTIKTWRIGYAPDDWRQLRDYLQLRDFSDDIMRKAGLIKGEASKEPYDVFRDRIMFPIFDASGRVIAFSGRLLSADTEAAKYINSPETELFHKSEALFGYHVAKEGMRKLDFALIVEGQFDVVLAQQAGYKNTVAVSGTALTSYHVTLLQRLTGRIVLALDSDKAGIAAVKRAAAVMLPRGIDLKVAHLPDGKDPADLIQEDVDEFKKAIAKSTHVVEFMLAVLSEKNTDERKFKLAAQEEILPILALLSNKIDQEHFVGVVAKKLEVKKEVVAEELERLTSQQKKAQAVPGTESKRPETITTHKKTTPQDLDLTVRAVFTFLDIEKKTVVRSVYQQFQLGEIDRPFEADEAELLNKYIFQLEPIWAKFPKKQFAAEVASALEQVRVAFLRAELSTVQEQLQRAESAGDEVAAHDALKKSAVLHKKLSDEVVTVAIFNESTD